METTNGPYRPRKAGKVVHKGDTVILGVQINQKVRDYIRVITLVMAIMSLTLSIISVLKT